jgi:hypothetical protein
VIPKLHWRNACTRKKFCRRRWRNQAMPAAASLGRLSPA